MAERLTAVDLFAGAGGLSLGFRNQGFDVRIALDNDRWAATTYSRNHPATQVVCDSIQAVRPGELLEGIGLRRGALTVLIGGPPCQDFSINNHQRGREGRRAGLVQHYLTLVAGTRPRFVLMENVTGLLSAENGFWREFVYRSLEHLGYRVAHKILSSEDYGVPQRRRRVFFVGTRDHEEVSWPQPTHLPEGRDRFVTVDAAIGGSAPHRSRRRGRGDGLRRGAAFSVPALDAATVPPRVQPCGSSARSAKPRAYPSCSTGGQLA